MKVWIEWKLQQEYDLAITPRLPNVFTTKENLMEFWKRVRFPADTVDWVFGRMAELGKTEVECDGWYAAEVEVDEYFVKKGSQSGQMPGDTETKIEKEGL